MHLLIQKISGSYTHGPPFKREGEGSRKRVWEKNGKEEVGVEMEGKRREKGELGEGGKRGGGCPGLRQIYYGHLEPAAPNDATRRVLSHAQAQRWKIINLDTRCFIFVLNAYSASKQYTS